MAQYLSLPEEPRRGRRRTLSVTNRTPDEEHAEVLSIGKLKAIKTQLETEWGDFASDDANPLTMALSFLDTSSVGLAKRLPDFLQSKEQLARCLQEAVNAQYQGFNNSVGAYGSVVQRIADSEQMLSTVQEKLRQSQDELFKQKDALRKMQSESMWYYEVLEMLDAINQLNAVPGELDAAIAGKNFAKAQQLLEQSEKLAQDYNLWNISALKGLQRYLLSQQDMLFESLVEDLHNRIYFKAGYLNMDVQNSLLQIPSKLGGANSVNLEDNLEQVIGSDYSESWLTTMHALDDFLSRLDRKTEDEVDEISDGFDASLVLELNSETVGSSGGEGKNDAPFKRLVEMSNFHQTSNYSVSAVFHIMATLNTLSELNKLEPALQLIVERLPAEIHRLVLQTESEVKQSYPRLMHDLYSLSDEAGMDFGPEIGDVRISVLQNLFRSIFTRLLAVLEYMKIIYELSRRILAKPQAGGSQSAVFSPVEFNFVAVWSAVEKEVRDLLCTYIVSQQNDTSGRRTQSSKSGKNEPLYQIARVDFETAPGGAKSHEESIEKLLAEAFPGVTHAAHTKYDPSPYISVEEKREKYQALVKPHVFNMRVVFEMCLMFVKGAQMTFPESFAAKRSAPLEFYHSFMAKVFYEQMKQFLYGSLQRVLDKDYQTADTYSVDIETGQQLMKSVMGFAQFLPRVCRVLNTGFQYREPYIEVVIGLVQRMVDRHELLLDELVGFSVGSMNPGVSGTVRGERYRVLAQWCGRHELQTVSLQLMTGVESETQRAKLLAHEAALLLAGGVCKVGSTTGLKHHDMLDKVTYESLCRFLASLSQLLVRLSNMKQISPEAADRGPAEHGTLAELKKQWSLLEMSRQTKTDHPSLIKLMLSPAAARRYDAQLIRLQNIIQKGMLLLRYDMAARVIFYIGKSMSEDQFCPTTEIIEKDPNIVELDQNVMRCDERLNELLGIQSRNAIITGLATLIDRVLITAADNIKRINSVGIKKLYSNILVIKQMLKIISTNVADLAMTQCVGYFELLKLNYMDIIEQAKTGALMSKYTYEEVKVILRLIFSEMTTTGDETLRISSNKNYKDALMKLHNAYWNPANKQ